MATLRSSTRILGALGTAVLLLSGCDKLTGEDKDTSQFARSALERNENLSIVAYDKPAKTFTVRVKSTGELRVLREDEVVGSVPGLAERAPAPVNKSTAEPAPSRVAPDNAVPAEPQSASAGEPARVDNAPASSPSTVASSLPGTAVITDSKTGTVLATNTTLQDTARADAAGKGVLTSGPGYSIKAGDPLPAAPVRLASRSSTIPSPVRGVAVEHRYEPMICQGARLLHIDGRNLEFEGDAISAEEGCEIHITNSHIIAHGLGVSARAANVHIQNSVIEGDSGSVSASEGAKVYTQQSTFKGLSRRLDTATFTDLGGTVWN